MSTTLTQPAWVSALLDTDLSFAERTVAAYLAWRQGRNGSAWPSQRTIAGDLGLTCDGVRKITQRLEAKGRLVATWSGPGRGRNHYKQYKITDPKKTQTAVPVLETGNPDSRLAFDEISEQENPDSRPKKTQTAVPRHIGITQTWNTYRKETRARTKTKATRQPAKFVPPTAEQVAAYAAERGCTDFDADKFIAYYEAADWHDSHGKPVRSWKQKMLSTWLKSGNGGNGRIVCGTAPADEDEVREFLRHCRAEREGLPA